MLLYNSIWGVGSLFQGFQAKKSRIRQVGFVPPALPLYSGRDLLTTSEVRLRSLVFPSPVWSRCKFSLVTWILTMSSADCVFNLPPSNSLTTKVVNFSNAAPKLGSEAISRKTQRDQASCLPTGKQLVDVGSGFLRQGSWKRSPFGCRNAMPAMVLTSLALYGRVCRGRTKCQNR